MNDISSERNTLHVIYQGRKETINLDDALPDTAGCHQTYMPLDVDWYLSHGYITLEEHLRRVGTLLANMD